MIVSLLVSEPVNDLFHFVVSADRDSHMPLILFFFFSERGMR